MIGIIILTRSSSSSSSNISLWVTMTIRKTYILFLFIFVSRFISLYFCFRFIYFIIVVENLVDIVGSPLLVVLLACFMYTALLKLIRYSDFSIQIVASKSPQRSKMHRSYYPTTPASSKLLQKRWDENHYQKHRHTVTKNFINFFN